jgi:hypothetical protein
MMPERRGHIYQVDETEWFCVTRQMEAF